LREERVLAEQREARPAADHQMIVEPVLRVDSVEAIDELRIVAARALIEVRSPGDPHEHRDVPVHLPRTEHPSRSGDQDPRNG
jgi:hypothetical protein